MSLKSIRTNYSKLLSAFQAAGVKLNESQKADLDTFIVALESKMNQMKEATVKTTKKIVTEHLDAEYKKIFESIMKHQAENAEIAGKIQNKISNINESKKLSRKINNYLDMYLESALPEKTVVDYDRLQKLEKLHESLKDMLAVNEDVVEQKKAELSESFDAKKKELETQIAKLQVKLNESMSKTQKLNAKIDQFKAIELLESKTKDLGEFEAKQVKARLAGATTTEINAKFKTVLESVKSEIAEEAEKDETSLTEEINNIIEKEEKKDKVDEKDVEEDDILKGRKHNGHLNEDDEDIDEAEDDKKDVDEAEDDIELDESEMIDSNLMAMWCDKVGTIETRGY